MDRLRILLISAITMLYGCSTSEVLIPYTVKLSTAQVPADESNSLDVAVVLFDPGVPDGEIDAKELEKLATEDVFVQIRRTEAIQMAVQLRHALQKSGHWGSAWITPRPSVAADVNVTAEILHSDGYNVSLDVTATDIAGHTWIAKRYDFDTAAAAYNRQRYAGLDPYQDLFNSIANDLAAAADELSPSETQQIKTVGALRYAEDMSAEAFDGYLAEQGGILAPQRLPALGDPLFERTQRVRQRERLFLETLDAHYENFAVQTNASYHDWREHAREESITIQELQRGARWRKRLGAVILLGSLLYGGGNVSTFSERLIQNSLFFAGASLLDMGTTQMRERDIHAETLKELSESFDEKAEPLVVEIAGVQHRLVGTADEQYEELRQLLRQSFLEQTGLSAPRSE